MVTRWRPSTPSPGHQASPFYSCKIKSRLPSSVVISSGHHWKSSVSMGNDLREAELGSSEKGLQRAREQQRCAPRLCQAGAGLRCLFLLASLWYFPDEHLFPTAIKREAWLTCFSVILSLFDKENQPELANLQMKGFIFFPLTCGHNCMH